MNRFDDNGNYYPSVYTRNTTNSPTHIQQLFQTPIASQYERVPFSAYFDKPLCGTIDPLPGILYGQILPSLNYRAKMAADSSATSPNHKIVFVYDIEEITMISDNHLVELEILLPHIKTRELYRMVEYVMLASGFHNSNGRVPDVMDNIEDAFNRQTDDRKTLSPEYDALKNMYDGISKRFDRKSSMINQEIFEKCKISETEKVDMCEAIEEIQKVYNQRWKTVDKCLKLVKKRSEKSTKKYANAVLSKQGLTYGAGQLIVSGHSSTIPIENIYSTERVSNEEVFERIQRRFGLNCTLVYVTSFPQRASLQAKPNIPIWHVTSNESIRMLYNVQQNYLLR